MNIRRRDLLIAAAGAGGGGVLSFTLLPPHAAKIRTFLTDHPEYLADSPALIHAGSTVAQARQQQGEAEARRALLADNAALLTPPGAPTLGQPNGAPGPILFLDYLHAGCRVAAAKLTAPAGTYAALLLIPVSGALSDYAAALAAACYFADAARFPAFHAALLAGTPPGQGRIDALVAAHGYDPANIAEQASGSRVRDYLAAARALAEALHITALPATLDRGGTLSR